MNTSLRDPAWGVAQLALRKEIANWIKGAMARNAPIPFQGGHDEANYTHSWAEYARLTGDPKPLEFMRTLRDQIIAWPKFHHGFYPDPTMDIEHSVENWTCFMSALARVEPEDEKTLAAIEDVVHHLGNWAPGVPDWYDWKTHRFTSEWVGTRGVRNFPPYDATTYWDARAAELALTYFELRADRKYLDWAADYAAEWARVVLEGKDTGPWCLFPISDREEIKRRYGEYPENFQTRNKGWIGEMGRLFLHVYRLTRDARFQRAALKIIEHTQPPAIPKQTYQDATGDLRFQADIKAEDRASAADAASLLDEPLPSVLLLEGDVTYPRRQYAHRGPSGELRDCTASPTALWRAFGLTDDARFAARAFELAALELRMACRTLRDGREHGCNGRFIHGAGAVAVRTLCGAACANEVEYFAADGPRGLPAAMAALVCVDEAHPNARRVCLYNDGPNPQTIRIRPAKDQPPMRNAFAEDGQSLFKDGAAVVVAAARNVTVVVVRN
ncbi:MAG: hypothetical protein FJ272_00625 [Planctomycetes bacterium]|nr:hypothetical protein [Planctomycetota bacterium]